MGSRESRTLTCPVCGHREYTTVIVYGDSDGDDGTGKLNPDKCPKCLGWKEASPVLYEKLRFHYDRAEGIKEETARQVYEYHLRHIDPWVIGNVICGSGNIKNFVAVFQEERRKCNQIALKVGKDIDNDWVLEKSVVEVLSRFCEELDKKNKWLKKG